ncbi:MAG: RidA family protein [Pseudomonadota bacterium]
MKAIHTSGAPDAIAPYSQAIEHGGLLYTCGQIALDPATGKLVEGGVEAQAHQVLTNLRAVVEAGGSRMERVLKTTVYLADMADYPRVNAIYLQHFPQGPRPARAAVAVKSLPLGALLEIDCIAAVE